MYIKFSMTNLLNLLFGTHYLLNFSPQLLFFNFLISIKPIMKIAKNVLLSAFALTLFVTSSCNNSPEVKEEKKEAEAAAEEKKPEVAEEKPDNKKMLVGTWKLDFDATVAQLPEEKKAKMKEATLKTLKEEYSKSDISFKEDGKYEAVVSIAAEGTATWTLNDKTIEVKRGDKVTKYELKELTTDKLVIVSEHKAAIFPTSVYTRAK